MARVHDRGAGPEFAAGAQILDGYDQWYADNLQRYQLRSRQGCEKGLERRAVIQILHVV